MSRKNVYAKQDSHNHHVDTDYSGALPTDEMNHQLLNKKSSMNMGSVHDSTGNTPSMRL